MVSAQNRHRNQWGRIESQNTYSQLVMTKEARIYKEKKKNIQGEKVSSLGGAGTTGHCLFQFRYFPEKFGEP